jgi:hypothetical protein
MITESIEIVIALLPNRPVHLLPTLRQHRAWATRSPPTIDQKYSGVHGRSAGVNHAPEKILFMVASLDDSNSEKDGDVQKLTNFAF